MNGNDKQTKLKPANQNVFAEKKMNSTLLDTRNSIGKHIFFLSRIFHFFLPKYFSVYLQLCPKSNLLPLPLPPQSIGTTSSGKLPFAYVCKWNQNSFWSERKYEKNKNDQPKMMPLFGWTRIGHVSSQKKATVLAHTHICLTIFFRWNKINLIEEMFERLIVGERERESNIKNNYRQSTSIFGYNS